MKNDALHTSFFHLSNQYVPIFTKRQQEVNRNKSIYKNQEIHLFKKINQ